MAFFDISHVLAMTVMTHDDTWTIRLCVVLENAMPYVSRQATCITAMTCTLFCNFTVVLFMSLYFYCAMIRRVRYCYGKSSFCLSVRPSVSVCP